MGRVAPRVAPWLGLVNAPQTDAELEAVRRAVRRGSPFGSEDWQKQMATRLGLEYTLRPRGRPKKSGEDRAGLFRKRRKELRPPCSGDESVTLLGTIPEQPAGAGQASAADPPLLVGESVSLGPRAGCGKSACPVR